MKYFSKVASIIIVILLLGTVSYLVINKVSVSNTGSSELNLATGINSIEFTHTDENEGEDLIITSDKKIYQGLSGTTVYFNIDPILKQSGDVAIQFYFTDPNAQITQIYKYEKDENYWQALDIQDGKVSDPKYSEAVYRSKEIDGEVYIQSNTTFSLSGEKEYFMAELTYTSGVPGQFLIETFGADGSYGILDPWYDTGWAYRKQITINPSKVAGTSHIDFPVLFSVTDPDLRDIANGGGVASSTAGDVLFVDPDGNKLDHEIEFYDNTTGELNAWIRMPFLSATTTFHIYYGNETVPLANQQNRPGVWDTNFQGVYHLGDDPEVGFYRDSTSNGNSGTLIDADGDTTLATPGGKIDGAIDFNGDADDILTTYAPSTVGTVTFEMWINPVGEGNINMLAKAGTGGTATIIFRKTSNEGLLVIRSFTTTSGQWNTANGTVAINDEWQHVAVVYDGSSGANDPVFYYNGQVAAITAETSPVGSVFNNTNAYRIGSQLSSSFWDGDMDEVRISNTLRSADWIATGYNNQSSPNTFYSYGGQGVNIRATSVASVKVRGKVNVRGGIQFR